MSTSSRPSSSNIGLSISLSCHKILFHTLNKSIIEILIYSKDRENISETITTNKVTLGDDIEMNDIPINTEMACEDGACAI